ncbi:MAG: HEAT repeat domain-containing protein [Thermodesulfobacteriota bacterium]
MDLQLDQHNNILKELVRAVKTLQLYPSGHPNLDVIMGKCFTGLHALVAEFGDTKWLIEADGFYYSNEKLMPNNPSLTDIAQQYFLRKVKEVTFRPELTVDELKHFISILSVGPVALHSKGGGEAYLARLGVLGVLLNDMSYANLLKLIEEEQGREEDEEEIEEIEEIEEETPEEMSEEEMAKEREAEELKEFERLLNQLKTEKDPLNYNDTAVRVIEKAAVYRSRENFSPIIRVLNVFTSTLDETTDTPDNISRIAEKRLQEMLTDDLIVHLIEALDTDDEEEKAVIEKILKYSGEKSHGLILDILIKTTETRLRRNIFNIVVNIGEPIRPEIISRLDDSRWFAVRQMVSLLGELGGEDSLTTLESMFEHPDVRVKKEVMKSLARIPSEKSLTLLLEGLKNKDRSIQAHSVMSLSILKNPEAVKPLGEIVARRDLLHENEELRKEAVKALGGLGDEAGVQYLKKVLLSKSWLASGVSENIKTLAATALGKIGGDEACEVLQKASKQHKGNIFNACKMALEGIKK